jgi:hypothetical protein
MANYFYNPCAPCCTGTACGWGPYSWTSPGNIAADGMTQTDFVGTPTWTVASGHLKMNGGAGSLWKQSLSPDPTGLLPTGHGWVSGSLLMQSVIYKDVSSQTTGIFVGNLAGFYADWTTNTYRTVLCDIFGSGNGGGGILASAPAPKDGDTLAVCAIPIGNAQPPGFANAKIQVTYLVNGDPVGTATITGPDGSNPAQLAQKSASQNAGMVGTTAGQWGTSFLQCGTGCPTTSTPPSCPETVCCQGQVPIAYKVTLSGGTGGCWSSLNGFTVESLGGTWAASPCQIDNEVEFNAPGGSGIGGVNFEMQTTYTNGTWPTCSTNTVIALLILLTGVSGCSGQASWQLSIPNFNGDCGSFTLPLVSDQSTPAGAPPSVTLIPVN